MKRIIAREGGFLPGKAIPSAYVACAARAWGRFRNVGVAAFFGRFLGGGIIGGVHIIILVGQVKGSLDNGGRISVVRKSVHIRNMVNRHAF